MTDLPSHAAAHGPRTLHDFEPLLPAERSVLRAAASGAIAKLGYRRPNPAAPGTRLRADFLAHLLRGGAGAAVKGQRLQIVGAEIVGRLDLSGAQVPVSLWLYRCSFAATPQFDRARVAGTLTFADCALPGLRAEACRIDGDLDLNAGCSLGGEVQLTHAVIARDLNCERLHLQADAQAAHAPRRHLVADGVQVGGDVLLSGGFESVGEVRFVAARIGGDLRADGAHLMADIDAAGTRGVALKLDRAQIGGSVCLNRGFAATGQVSLRQARIEGDLDCSDAAFDVAGDATWGEQSGALLLDRARIGGALDLRRLQEPLQGASLSDTRVGSLRDDAASWGAHHVLDGFVYTRFETGAPTDAAMRLAWLTRQNSLHVGADYRPEPWRRAIQVLHRMGRDASARDLAIGRERHLRRAGRVGQDAPRALRWAVRASHAGFGALAGYGHRPWRLLALAAAAWLLCGAAYWAAAQHGRVAPSAWLLLADPRLAACRTECRELPATAPRFHPFVYSLELLVPLLDLQQQRHWAPTRSAAPSGFEAATRTPPLRLLTWCEALFGWTVVLALIACLSGLTDRDRRG